MAHNFKENSRLAFRAIRTNPVRTILTLTIIAIGITALVGILTAIDSMKASINSNFSDMGANTFTIRNMSSGVQGGRHGEEFKVYEVISYEQARSFKERYDFPGTVTLSTVATRIGTIKRESLKTHPNIAAFGVDENYLSVLGYTIQEGRNFSPQELQSGSHSIILGSDVYDKLFSKGDTVIGSQVSIGNIKYNVVAVLESKGNSIMASDNVVFVPLLNVKSVFPRNDRNYTISVEVESPEILETATSEAIGLLRNIRKLDLKEEDNFSIAESDRLANTVIDQLRYVRMGAVLIGIVTLLGAAVGLMNIMLVAVAERTREIGVCKAVGAKSKEIIIQFLTEAVMICQLGGVLGIILGILIGYAVSQQLNSTFVIPWLWIGTGIVVCFVVGLASGIYPAMMAAKLDPVEALRSE